MRIKIQPGNSGIEQGPETEPAEAEGVGGGSAVPAYELGGERGDQPAHEDHRTEDVEQEREVPAVRTDGGEHGHAPGL